jgi:hypothetical protein
MDKLLVRYGFPQDSILLSMKDSVGILIALELSRIGPLPAADVVLQEASADIAIIHGGDLKLSTCTGLDLADEIEDAGIIEVESHDRIVGLGSLRLLLDLNHVMLIESRDTIVLGLVHGLEQYSGALCLLTKPLRIRRDGVLEDVVTQDDADASSGSEVFGQPERMRDAPCGLLNPVAQRASEFGT